MDARERASLDRYITGNYGEDQFKDDTINVVIAYRRDGRVQVFSDSESVRVIIDKPDDEEAAPVLYEAACEPGLVAGVVEEAEEEN